MASGDMIWGYGDDDGPAVWAELDPSFALCATGRAQSPIDLAAAVAGKRGDLALSYHLERVTVVDGGVTQHILPEIGGTASYEDIVYRFVGLHAHTPAEHVVGDWQADAEAHFVHQTPAGATAVIGVFLEALPGAHPFDVIIEPRAANGESVTLEQLVDLQRLIPTTGGRYRYVGSLTTPPGTEGVQWIVMEDAQPVGQAALEAFTARYGPNNRPTQPLNDRPVTLG